MIFHRRITLSLTLISFDFLLQPNHILMIFFALFLVIDCFVRGLIRSVCLFLHLGILGLVSGNIFGIRHLTLLEQSAPHVLYPDSKISYPSMKSTYSTLLGCLPWVLSGAFLQRTCLHPLSQELRS